MKKTIMAIDTNDIFQAMTRTPESTFSAIRVSADEAEKFCAANLCLELFDRLSTQPYQICESGDVLMRIMSPSSTEITIEDVEMICGTIRRFCSGNIIRGIETDDLIETINVDLIFEINI